MANPTLGFTLHAFILHDRPGEESESHSGVRVERAWRKYSEGRGFPFLLLVFTARGRDHVTRNGPADKDYLELNQQLFGPY